MDGLFMLACDTEVGERLRTAEKITAGIDVELIVLSIVNKDSTSQPISGQEILESRDCISRRPIPDQTT